MRMNREFKKGHRGREVLHSSSFVLSGPSRDEPQRGFTLIETCIAMVILMIVVCGVLPLGVYALKYNSAAAIRAGAVTAAQRKLEQLRAGSFTSCISSSEVVSVGPTDSHTYTLRNTSGGVYSGNESWMRGQVVIYSKRTTSWTGSNLG